MHTSILHPLYYSLIQQNSTITPRAHGIDISKHDKGFNPSNTNKQLDFIAQRTSYRLTKDELFDAMVPFVMQVPIRIAYHYYNFGYSGDGTWQDQVNFMASIIRGFPFHATAWDFEGAYNVLSRQAAVNSYYAIKELEQKTGMPSFLYTSLSLYNEYIYPTIASDGLNWNSVPLWLAQWLLTPDPNKNPSTPKGRAGLALPWDIWQYTDKGDDYGTVRNYPTDLNVYNGTVGEMMTRLNVDGETPPPPTNGDVVTHPMDGVTYTTGLRNNVKYYMHKFDKSKIDAIRVIHEYGKPSQICKKYGADYAFNGDDWDDGTYIVQGMEMCDGVVKKARVNGEPSLIVLKDGTIGINHINIANQYQVGSGVRYIVRDGKPTDRIQQGDATSTEVHARSLTGLDRDGNLMMFTSDGDYYYNGLKFIEAAQIMIEPQHNCLLAFDRGGGGDSVCVEGGTILNVPDDVSNGQPAERSVPQTILVWMKEGTTMPTENGIANENGGRTAKVRKTPSRYGAEANYVIGPYVRTEFTEKVPCIPQGTADKDGEMWLKLPDGNYTNYKLYSGSTLVTYFDIIKEPGTEPTEPPVSQWPATYEEERVVRVDGIVVATYKGTMTKQ